MSLVGVKPTVDGVKEWSRAIGKGPRVFRRRMLGATLRETEKFIGKTGKGQFTDGVFRKKLLRKKNKWGGTWDKRIVHIVRSVVDAHKNPNKVHIDAMMGIPKSNSKLLAGLDLLGTGGSYTTSKMMIIPRYLSLRRIGVRGDAYQVFRRMRAHNALAVVKKNGRMLYINKAAKEKKNQLLFVGSRSVRVKKRIPLQTDWARRQPGFMIRLDKAVDRAIVDVAKGKRE